MLSSPQDEKDELAEKLMVEVVELAVKVKVREAQLKPFGLLRLSRVLVVPLVMLEEKLPELKISAKAKE